MTKTSIYRCCYLKLELNGLEGGGGLDAPDPRRLSDLHHLNVHDQDERVMLLCQLFEV